MGVRVLLSVSAPLAVAILWGLFAAPKARIRVAMVGVLAVKAVAFGSAAVAIHALGLHRVAIGVAPVAFLNTAVATADRDAAMRGRPE